VTNDLTDSSYWSEYWRARSSKKRSVRPSRGALLPFVLDRALPQPGTVLEVGCAAGEMLVRMSGLRPQHEYHGLDFSEHGLEETRRLLDDTGTTASLHQGDVRDPGAMPRFDLVTSFGLVEHFEDPAAILAAHARLARPGGWVAVSLPNFSSAPCRWFMRHLDPRALQVHSFTLMNPARLEAALLAAGLTDVLVQGYGGPKVRTSCPTRTRARSMLRFAARAWNAGSRLVPAGMSWQATLLGMGRVPE